MTWFRVDDDLPFHRKVVMAGNAAMGLWVRAGAWSSQQLTDGFVPDDMIALIGTPAQRKKLISARLWIEVDGGCQFHEWNETGRQPTSRSVRERRADAAGRQAKHRANLYRSSQHTDSCNDVTNVSVTEAVTPVLTHAPTRPVPTSTSADADAPPASGDSEPNAGQLVGEWLESCRRRPPGRVVARVGKEVKAMLAEDIAAADVRAGIALWAAKGLDPSVLPSVVNTVMNKPGSHLQAVPPSRSLPPDPDAALAELRARADAIGAGELLGRSYIEPAKPPSDPTPMDCWRRDRAVEFIDANAAAIRAALAGRRAG